MEGHASYGILLRPIGSGSKKSASSKSEQDDYNISQLPPVHQAAARGRVDKLEKMVARDPSNLEYYSEDGLTPLSQAVLCQQKNAVKKLLELGANIDAQDNVGRTSLSIASYQGWHQGVTCLLKNGAKQSIPDKAGRYPLHAATYHSDMSTLSILLTGLTSKEINLADEEMMTAVHWAAFHDRPEHLLLLVQKGGDIKTRDIDGRLPLHWAAQNNSFQCAHRLTSLVEGQSTVNDLDLSGKSPVHYAAASGAANILTILSRCEGCNLEMEDPEERTPLHWAAAMGHSKAVDTLMELGVEPFPIDMDGGTPLEYALQAGNKECIKVMEDRLGAAEVKNRREILEKSASSRRSSQRASQKYQYMQPPAEQTVPRDIIQDVEHGHVGIAVPDIAIQPPTTMTMSQSVYQSSTNPSSRPVYTVPADRGRMYSASSTDTDDLDTHQRKAHAMKPLPNPPQEGGQHHGMGPLPNPQEGQWGALYEHENKKKAEMAAEIAADLMAKGDDNNEELVLSVENLKHVLDEQQDEQVSPNKDSALAGLIGSSFVAGALGPVLSPMGNLPLDTFSHESESPDKSRRVSDPPETARWANSGKDIPLTPLTGRDSGRMKVKTSNNTPVERVSVQSFRSIPPIPTSTDGATSPRNVRSQASLDLGSVEEARV